MGNDAARVRKWFYESLKPEEILTVSKWADKHRILSSKSSSEAGQWRTERTPYAREIMDVLSITHPSRKVVFKKAAQIGGTEIGQNWVGYIIDHAPGPLMMVLPRIEDARRNSKLRIEPLISESERLRSKVSPAKSRDSSNTMLQKGFDGGELVMTGANSGAGLRSMPAKYLFLDETDAYPYDVDGEGDPISLVMARSRTFSRRKAFLCSTPTIEGASKIDFEFKASDQRYYQLPCPHCDHYQKLEFKNLQWPEGKPKETSYYCCECGEQIVEKHKTEMLRKGKWVAENPESDVVGFHLNSLYSPVGWFSWGDIAEDYIEAKRELETLKKTEKMRTFTNTVLGETYADSGEAPDWEKIYRRREQYKMGTVPKGGITLTAGVDIQKDRIEIEVLAHGLNKETWSVDYNVIPGDTDKPEAWNELEKYIFSNFPVEGTDFEVPIKAVGIDSGYNTHHVYNFCRKFPVDRVFAFKGADELTIPIGLPKAVDVKKSGKTIRRGVKVWRVGVSVLKKKIYSQLKLETPIDDAMHPEGFCHFPEYDSEYFKQLTAEKLVTKTNTNGFPVIQWVKGPERNEALDCRVYNMALAALLGLDRQKPSQWEKDSKNMKLAKPLKTDKNKSTNQSTPKRKRTKRKSSYWD